MGAVVQLLVPVAVPLDPPLEDQVTELTPELSVAVPRRVMVAAVVVDVAEAGFVMVMDGAVVS